MVVNKAFYFSGGGYLRTLQGLHRALATEPAVQFLLGKEGTGKSALCEKLAQFLRRKQQPVLHLAAGVESVDLLRIALARKLDLTAQGSPAVLIEEAVHAGNQPIILIIDDAHLLTEVVLLEIERMAQVTVQGQQACSLVLSGEPALLGRLQGRTAFPELSAAASRPFVLDPMTATELEVFLQTFAADSGIGDLGFSEDAMHLLYQLCRGYPGPAAKLGAEVVASVSGKARSGPLTRHDLDQVVENNVDDRLLPSLKLTAQSSRPGLLPLAVVVVIASVALVYQQLDEQTGENLAEIASDPIAESSPFADSSAGQARAADPIPAGAEAQPTTSVATTDAGVPDETPSGESTQPAVDSRNPDTVELDEDRARLLAAMEQARRAAEAAAQAATDSDLVLVTAAERGISEDQFALPRYEDLLVESGQSSSSGIPPQTTPADTSAASATDSVVSGPLADAVAATAESEQQSADTPAASSTPTEVVTDQQESVSALAGDDAAGAPQVATMANSQGNSAVQTEVVADSDAELRAAVTDWIQAWQAQDLDAYFDRYHSRYQPRYQDSVAQWRSNRQRVIGNAAWIELELSDFQVVEREADSVEVHFWLAYESGSYQDRTLKKLVLAREDNRWRILEEVNLEVQA